MAPVSGKRKFDECMFNHPAPPSKRTIMETISDVLFPNSVRLQAQQFNQGVISLVRADTRWTQIQQGQRPIPEPAANADLPEFKDLQNILNDFFYGLSISYFEATLIGEIQNILSTTLSDTVGTNAKEISDLLLTNKTEIQKLEPKTMALLNKVIRYLAQTYNEVDKKDLFKRTLVAINPAYVQFSGRFSDDNCPMEEIIHSLGYADTEKLFRNLGQELVPVLLKSNAFIQKLQKSIFHTIRPLVEMNTEGNQVSSLIQVTARIGSALIAKRLTKLYYSLSIPEIIDKLFLKVNLHISSFIEAHKQVKAQPDHPDPNRLSKSIFSSTEGCHPVTRSLMRANADDSDSVLTDFFKKISKTLVEYVLDRETILQFIHELRANREQLIAGLEKSPFLVKLIDALLDPSNEDLLVTFMEELAPLATEGLATGLDKLLIDTVFPRDKIYTIILDQIEPPVLIVLQKVIVKELIKKRVEDAPFISSFEQIFNQYQANPETDLSYLVTVLGNDYTQSVLKDQPQTIKAMIPTFTKAACIEVMEAIKKKTPLGLNFKETLKKALYQSEVDEVNKPYGEVAMNAIFGISDKGAMAGMSKLRKNAFLTNFFEVAILDGLSPYRKSENPNEVLFRALQPLLEPFRDKEAVKKLLLNGEPPLSKADRLGKIAGKSAEISLLLRDLLRFVIPVVGRAVSLLDDAAIDMKGQLEYILTELFKNNLVNYNLAHLALETIEEQVRKAKK